MNIIVDRGDQQFNVGSEPYGEPVMINFHKVLSLPEMKASVHEHKNLHTDLPGVEPRTL
jgi:hypothetical protein